MKQYYKSLEMKQSRLFNNWKQVTMNLKQKISVPPKPKVTKEKQVTL